MIVDLTPVGGAPTLCVAAFTESSGGVLEDFIAIAEGLNAEQYNKLFADGGLKPGVATHGSLADGKSFNGTIASFLSYHPGIGGSIAIQGRLANVSLAQQQPNAQQPAEWVFVLANLKLHLGDYATSYPAEHRQANDSIIFDVNGRSWRLTDRYANRWNKLSKDEMRSPIASGLLSCAFNQGDTDEAICGTAQDICDVLAVALSRSINWISYSLNDSNGNAIRAYSRYAWTTGFNKHGFEPVDNHEPFALQGLLEKAVPVVAADRDWYSKTLGMLVQAQIADMLEVRCSILYTLADRISTRINVKTGEPEIDKDLKPRAKKQEFIDSLHAVLSTLSPENWSLDHTKAVINEVKRWNSMPAFVTKIQRACNRLSIPEPDKDLLRPRNDLLHNGELDPGDADTKSHYLELDWVVLAMTLRLFGYDGVYYHPKFGHNPAVLSDHLVPRDQSNPT